MNLEHWATLCFIAAILHTFLVKHFVHFSRRFQEGTIPESLLHLMGEVEVVFGIWAGIFLSAVAVHRGSAAAVAIVEGTSFIEPVLVFVIMVICATRPIMDLVGAALVKISSYLPIAAPYRFFCCVLIVGPLLGSLITEPAAMTVVALLLRDHFFRKSHSHAFKYTVLGALFVNISIGGTLTPYAAPPLLMVVKAWGWGLHEVFSLFGVRAILACFCTTALTCFRLRKELSQIHPTSEAPSASRVPAWVSLVRSGFLGAVVATHHSLPVFFGIFAFFLGWVSVSRKYQDDLKLKEGILVGFFLAGLVVLGGFQRWWLEPLFSFPFLQAWNSLPLYLGAMGLTSITDNAALTFLGAQVPGLLESARRALVAGAVVGGGLTVIANAPNPAGYGILNSSFGKDGINPLRLFLGATIPTAVTAFIFWI